MNILTDVLSLIRRSVFAKKAELNDVLILGVNEEPEMTGVASPIPYKSIKVIKVRDFKVAAEHCGHANSPATPAAGTGQVYQKTVSDEVDETCTVYFRSLKSLSSNLTLANSSDDDYVEITTTGEPNAADNVGSGAQVWKDKVGEKLMFRSIVQGTNVTVAQSANEITINSSLPYTSYAARVSAGNGTGPLAVQLYNTTGLTVVWTREGSGVYKATVSGGTVAEAKFWGNIQQGSGAGVQAMQWSSTTEIELKNYTASTGAALDSLANMHVEFRIYP
jgi:hypothetical protein